MSVIVGYEVSCRVYGATAARLAVHPHGTFGPMAAALALCKQQSAAPDRIAPGDMRRFGSLVDPEVFGTYKYCPYCIGGWGA